MSEIKAGHDITKFEIEMIHRDKDGNIKGVYHEEVTPKKPRDKVIITPDDIGDISELGGV
jgi:hypothetical protein